MIFIEPTQVYDSRASCGSALPRQGGLLAAHENATASTGINASLHSPLAFPDGWDEAIIAHILCCPGKVVRIVSVVSQLRKYVRHRCKAHKEELKLHILNRIGVLIRTGDIERVKRKFITVRRNQP